MDILHFDAERAQNIKEVRMVVYRIWKDKGGVGHPTFPLGSMVDSFHGKYVTFSEERARSLFLQTYLHILWESMIGGIVVPNTPRSGEMFPGLTITDFGVEVLENEHAVPYNQEEFIEDVRNCRAHCIDDVTLAYLRESLGCFNRGLYDASVILLGVAAESVFFNFSVVVAKGVPSQTEERNLTKLRWIGDRMRRVNAMVDKYKAWRGDRTLESVDLSLKAVFHMIRKERNELGHPVSVPRTSKRKAFAYLVSFAEAVEDVERFAKFIVQNGLS